MTTFVLVPGAWGGAWLWEPVTRGLQARGHDVHPVTLPGLAAHSADPVAEITLADHVADVRDLLTRLDLREVVLVGHSYSGIVTGQVAAAEPERVRQVVFVDSNLPVHGRGMVDGWSPEGQERVRAQIAKDGGLWMPLAAEDIADQGMTDAQIDLFVSRGMPHPGRTILDAAVLERPLAELSATYINCTVPQAEMVNEATALVGTPSWTFVEIPTGHWPMLSRPDALVEVLEKVEV